MTDYYHIISKNEAGGEFQYKLALHASCEVYAGHFPGHPISPGACNLEMIRQCVSDAMGKNIRISLIRQCRYLKLVTPLECPELELRFRVTEMQLVAGLYCNDTTYVSLKATIG